MNEYFHWVQYRQFNYYSNPIKNRGWTQVLRKGKQFMLHHDANLSKVVPYKQTFLCISETWSINSSLSLRSWSHSFSTDCWKLSNSDTRLFNVFICKSCDVDVDSVLVNCRFIITMKIIIIIIAVLKITTKYVTVKPVLIEPLWDWRICSV